MIIYTAITGRDELREDIKCFTKFDEFKRPVLNAKIYKILPWNFLDTDISLWVDGNSFPLKTENEYLELLGDNDMVVFKHPTRSTVLEEKSAIQFYYPQHFLMAEMYWKRLEKLGFKDNQGLYHCANILRRHNDKVKHFCSLWWSEIMLCSRDQMSFPYVKSLTDLKIKVADDNDYFKIYNHKDLK